MTAIRYGNLHVEVMLVEVINNTGARIQRLGFSQAAADLLHPSGAGPGRRGNGAGPVGGRCIMSRLGALYVITAIEEAAAGGRRGVPAKRPANHRVLAAGRPGGRMLSRARRMLAAAHRGTGGARGGAGRGRPRLGAAGQAD